MRFLLILFFFAVGAYWATEIKADIVILSRQRHAAGHVELGSQTDTAQASDFGTVRQLLLPDLDSRQSGGWLSEGSWPSFGSKAEAYATQEVSLGDEYITLDSVLFTENIQTGPPAIDHVFSTASSGFDMLFDVRHSGARGEFLLFGYAPEVFELTDQDTGILMPAQAGPVYLEPGRYLLKLSWVRSTDYFGETFFADQSSFVFLSQSRFQAIPEPGSALLLAGLIALLAIRKSAQRRSAACGRNKGSRY